MHKRSRFKKTNGRKMLISMHTTVFSFCMLLISAFWFMTSHMTFQQNNNGDGRQRILYLLPVVFIALFNHYIWHIIHNHSNQSYHAFHVNFLAVLSVRSVCVSLVEMERFFFLSHSTTIISTTKNVSRWALFSSKGCLDLININIVQAVWSINFCFKKKLSNSESSVLRLNPKCLKLYRRNNVKAAALRAETSVTR